MPARKGKCINFGLCPKADSREVITVNDGEEFSCPFPDCRKPLQPLAIPPPAPRSPRLIIGGILAILAIIVTGLFWYPWRKPVPPMPDIVQKVIPLPSKTTSPNPCTQIDWENANANDVLSNNCKGRGIIAYDRRMAYIESLREMKNWASVKSADPRLHDCAGVHACEERAQEIRNPPPPRPPFDWARASCEEVKATWGGEESQLSTPTCGGLSQAACSHIQRCLGLHPPSVGPGKSPE